MEEDLILDSEIKSSLKIASHLTKIIKGNYLVDITKETFTIILKLE